MRPVETRRRCHLSEGTHVSEFEASVPLIVGPCPVLTVASLPTWSSGVGSEGVNGDEMTAQGKRDGRRGTPEIVFTPRLDTWGTGECSGWRTCPTRGSGPSTHTPTTGH